MLGRPHHKSQMFEVFLAALLTPAFPTPNLCSGPHQARQWKHQETSKLREYLNDLLPVPLALGWLCGLGIEGQDTPWCTWRHLETPGDTWTSRHLETPGDLGSSGGERMCLTIWGNKLLTRGLMRPLGENLKYKIQEK